MLGWLQLMGMETFFQNSEIQFNIETSSNSKNIWHLIFHLSCHIDLISNYLWWLSDSEH